MTFSDLTEALAGVVAVSVTPFDAHGAIDSSAYARVVRRMVDSGIHVVTPNGNTGEFYALTPEERRRSVELATEAVAGDAFVLAGVGNDMATAVSAAEDAERAGAKMIMVHQPVHPYVALDGWVDYHRTIASAVPALGVVLYIRDPRIGAEQIRQLASSCDNIVGIKYAVRDVVQFAKVMRDVGERRLTWVAGLAELFAPAYFAMGARGFTSGLANVAPHLSLALLRHLREGDTPAARGMWNKLRDFEDMRGEDQSANNVSVVKEALHQLGLCGPDVRPPSRLLRQDERARVTKSLEAWDLDGTPRSS